MVDEGDKAAVDVPTSMPPVCVLSTTAFDSMYPALSAASDPHKRAEVSTELEPVAAVDARGTLMNLVPGPGVFKSATIKTPAETW